MSDGTNFDDALREAGDKVDSSGLIGRLRSRAGSVAQTAVVQRSHTARRRQLTIAAAVAGLLIAAGILYFALTGGGDSADDPDMSGGEMMDDMEPSGMDDGPTPLQEIPINLLALMDEAGMEPPPDLLRPSEAVDTMTAPAGLSAAAAGLVPAPVPDLIENTPFGPLPVQAEDGRTPLSVYSRPVAPGSADGPVIALVMGDFGLSRRLSEDALDLLPPDVTLAVASQTNDAAGWGELARSFGHEILIGLPMEPANYPAVDPGPRTLLTSLGPATNRDRALLTMGQAVGYTGIVAEGGGAFTASREALEPLMVELAGRGLMLLDRMTALESRAARSAFEAGASFAIVDAMIGEPLRAGAIDARLLALEEQARRQGFAVGWLVAKPIVLERTLVWLEELERRGVSLVPLSALANRQPLP